MALIEIRGLSKRFGVGRASLFGRRLWLQALQDVSLSIEEGEILGLVGESGCGKSTLARILLRLLEPDAGSIAFDGTDLLALRGGPLRRFRRNLQLVFQDPAASFNPRMTAEAIVAEPLVIHERLRGRARRARACELLQEVGLGEEALDKYPRQFSGGQRQRIGIARALALRPRCLIADEPVSALDVSVRAQILNLLAELQRKRGLTMLFISHDLNVVRYLADRVAVMYLGRIVELTGAGGPFLHPYTQALLAAVPQLGAQGAPPPPMPGEPPSPLSQPPGCAFHPRCPLAVERCRTEIPALEAKQGECRAACHRVASAPKTS